MEKNKEVVPNKSDTEKKKNVNDLIENQKTKSNKSKYSSNK